jgi:hypothetical protein
MKMKLGVAALMLVSVFGAASAAAWSGRASRVGDLVYKGTGLDSLYVGHVGVLYDEPTRNVSDVTDGRGEHALKTTRTISSFENDSYDGARRFVGQQATGLSAPQKRSLQARIAYFIAYKVSYDYNHLDQKGTWFQHNHWWEANSHWEFDCVGFTERIMEDIGLNPTSGSFESGWGWPLTPAEQRDSSNLTAAPNEVQPPSEY